MPSSKMAPLTAIPVLLACAVRTNAIWPTSRGWGCCHLWVHWNMLLAPASAATFIPRVGVQSCTFCHLSHDRRKASRSERKARLTDPTTPSTDEEIFLGLPEVSPLLPFGQAVVPPPGLTSLLATQPVTPVWKDEDLELPIPSPLGSTFMNPLSLTSTGCLATVPMTNPATWRHYLSRTFYSGSMFLGP